MKKIVYIIIPIIICFLIGYSAQLFQSEAIENWYPILNKSVLNPPNIAFPIAWSILYLFMGLSIGLIIISDSHRKKFFISIFAIQLFLNFMWSISFFYLQNPLLGLINIILLEGVIIYYAVKTYREFRVSSILFIPYILWVWFATYLNLYILMNN